jgi:hypothetical protein
MNTIVLVKLKRSHCTLIYLNPSMRVYLYAMCPQGIYQCNGPKSATTQILYSYMIIRMLDQIHPRNIQTENYKTEGLYWYTNVSA